MPSMFSIRDPTEHQCCVVRWLRSFPCRPYGQWSPLPMNVLGSFLRPWVTLLGSRSICARGFSGMHLM